MVVALGALHGQAEEGSGGGVDAIDEILDAVVFIDDSAFVGGRVVAKKARRGFLLIGSIGEEIAGHLPGNELVIGQVLVEGGDEPVAPGVDAARVILEEAVGVAVARHVEPLEGEAFAISGRGKEPVHRALVGVLRLIAEKGVELRNGGRQAGEVQGHAAEQLGPIGRRGWFQFVIGEDLQDEGIDPVAGPGMIAGRRRDGLNRRDEGPMELPLRTFRDPLADEGNFVLGDLEVRLWRRHHLVGIRVGEPVDDGALVGLARNDGNHPFAENSLGDFLAIEPQVGLARGRIRTVAGIAAVGEDGANVVVEGDRGGGRGWSQAQQRDDEVEMSFHHARIGLTTLPWTSVSRKRRPWCLKVRRS